jgi:anti-anti-sigma factor
MILEIDVHTSEDNIPLMQLKGEIDLHTCAPFRDTLRELIDQKRYNIVIDLSEVPYLDSAALGVLVDAVRRVREFNGAIYLVAPTPFVRRAFDITRLIKIFQLCDTEAEALASIRNPDPAEPANQAG